MLFQPLLLADNLFGGFESDFLALDVGFGWGVGRRGLLHASLQVVQI